LNSTLLSGFKQYVQDQQLIPQGTRVLLALSGGVDSVVLGHLLKQVGMSFEVLHVNFQLRGAESDRDEAFAGQFARQWEVPITIQRFDTEGYAALHRCSIQVAARELRYAWFETIRMQRSSDGRHAVIATAHHANDSVETMLMNLFRGTGVEGMHGILPKRDHIIRPLLFASRNDILTYATANGIEWVEDSSNESSKYTRNFIRQEVIPAIEKVYPSAVANMLQTISNMQEAAQLYNQALQVHKKKLLQAVKNEWHIPIRLLLKTKPLRTVLFELIHPFGFSSAQLDEVLKLCQASNGAYIDAVDWRIIRNRAWLVVAPKANSLSDVLVLNDVAGKLAISEFELSWQLQNVDFNKQGFPTATNEVMLDAKHLQWPLLLRRWKAGDYLYPLGMGKKKKVARLLIDLKLSKTEKEKVWVLECDKKIVWVVGFRLDERFKLTPTTHQALHLQYKTL
jgi:tRNA(Ile)-lysidine synthase